MWVAERGRRNRRAGVALLLAAALGGVAVGPLSPSTAPSSPPVILHAANGSTTALAAQVHALGGDVKAELPVADVVVATLPSGATLPAGARVVPDRALATAGVPAAGPADVMRGTMRRTIGAPDDSNLGAGMTVAVVDTGVADIPDLPHVEHVNVTDAPTGDHLGHGTFMAGLIAGQANGVAPGARILDVQVADDAGQTSLLHLLLGLQAVADDPSVDVVNLSLSVAASSDLDPLYQALNELWASGLTIVVAAGNTGPKAGTITAPGDITSVITVGALDERGTQTRSDDIVAGFSSRPRSGQSKPDIVAPGVSVVSSAAPEGIALAENPASAIEDTGLMRATGTSMSAAIVSGAAAAILATNPSLTPDAVKMILRGSTYTAAGLKSGAGTGALDLGRALKTAPGGPVGWVRGGYTMPGASTSSASGEDSDWASRSWASRSWASRSWASRSWAADVWSARSWASRTWS